VLPPAVDQHGRRSPDCGDADAYIEPRQMAVSDSYSVYTVYLKSNSI
jgi:hypothetical protein